MPGRGNCSVSSPSTTTNTWAYRVGTVHSLNQSHNPPPRKLVHQKRLGRPPSKLRRTANPGKRIHLSTCSWRPNFRVLNFISDRLLSGPMIDLLFRHSVPNQFGFQTPCLGNLSRPQCFCQHPRTPNGTGVPGRPVIPGLPPGARPQMRDSPWPTRRPSADERFPGNPLSNQMEWEWRSFVILGFGLAGPPRFVKVL